MKNKLPRGMGAVWVASHQGKHFCHCGCGMAIPIQIHHHARGIPRFIDGHVSRVSNPMTGRSGRRNPNYREGRYINPQGYVLILIPGPGRSRYQLEHRMVMEKHIGRKLERDEVVHHKNGVKTDNRLSNLELLSNSSHTKHHAENGHTGFRAMPELRKSFRRFSPEQVRTIRRAIAGGESRISVASRFGVAVNTVGMIYRKESYADID